MEKHRVHQRKKSYKIPEFLTKKKKMNPEHKEKIRAKLKTEPAAIKEIKIRQPMSFKPKVHFSFPRREGESVNRPAVEAKDSKSKRFVLTPDKYPSSPSLRRPPHHGRNPSEIIPRRPSPHFTGHVPIFPKK